MCLPLLSHTQNQVFTKQTQPSSTRERGSDPTLRDQAKMTGRTNGISFYTFHFCILDVLTQTVRIFKTKKLKVLKYLSDIDCLILKFHLYLIFKCLPLLRLSKEKRTSWSIQNSEDFRITWIHSSCFFYFRPHCPTNFALSRMRIIYTFFSFSYSTIFRRAKANCRKSAFLKSHSKDKEAKKTKLLNCIYSITCVCIYVCEFFSLFSYKSTVRRNFWLLVHKSIPTTQIHVVTLLKL